jgi:hypothetical protein
MNQLQPRDSGSCFAAFSLRILDTRVEIVKIRPRCPAVSLFEHLNPTDSKARYGSYCMISRSISSTLTWRTSLPFTM